jgi:tetratricopeptide (TPR) repeat protein
MSKPVLRSSILVLASVLMVGLLNTPVVRSQTSASDAVLKPPRKELTAVHLPDLSTLEQGVREQLTSEQDSLAATLKNPTISDAALSEAYGKLGQLYHAYSLTASARECYLNASRLAPQEFRWIYLLAKLDQQEGRFADAIDRFSRARNLRPDYAAAPVNLGNIFLELNRLSDAEGAFTKAREIDKNNPAALYGMGQVLMSNRNYTAAVELFEQTLAQVPGANRVHYSLAMAYRGLGNAESMKAHLAQQGPVGVRVVDPVFDGLQDLVTGERVYLSRGKVAFEARRFAEAAAEFRKAVAAKPNSVTARVNLGAALSQTGDVTGAGEQFTEALRIDPANGNAHYNLGIILAVQNRTEQAIAHLRSALAIEPNDTNARFLLAQQLKKSGNADEALSEFSRVIQIDPANESALLELVKLLYRKGQFKLALDGLEKSYAQYPQRGRTVVLLAYLLAASPQSDLRKGARALEFAQRVYGTSSTPQYGALVALALAELGRCSEAADWQRRMIVAAENEKNTDLLVKLRAGLKRYENPQSCRPENETILADLFIGS